MTDEQTAGLRVIEVREVLADTYRWRTNEPQSMLLHAVVVKGGRDVAVLCRRVKLDNLADAGAVEDVNADPTCPHCRRALGLEVPHD